MSEMKTRPVFRCKRCEKPVVATHLSTLEEDPEGKRLSQLMKVFFDIAYCESCLEAYNYYAREGRLDEFHAAEKAELIAVPRYSPLDEVR